MKKVISILAFAMLVSFASFAKSSKQPASGLIKVLHSEKHTLFIKVKSFFVGGTIEVYSPERQLLEGDNIPHQLTKMFFDDVPPGDYIIKVTKDKMSFEFVYHNV